MHRAPTCSGQAMGSGGIDLGQARQSVELRARYDVVLEMASAVRKRGCIEDVANVVCKGWRFCANVARWRALTVVGSAYSVVCCDDTGASVVKGDSSILSSTDRRLWAEDRPFHLSRQELREEYADLAAHFGSDDVSGVVVLPFQQAVDDQRNLLMVGIGPGGLQPLDMKFIEAVGSLLSGEICYLMTVESLTSALKHEARVCPLTGIANRRRFMEVLDVAWRDALRRQSPLSLLMIDIDHFKQFNDTYGHPAGDECLRRVASALSGAVRRPRDLIARVGGEEFAALLGDTDGAGAMMVGHLLLTAVDALAAPHEVAGKPTHVSISIGCATIIPVADLEYGELMKRADDSLYAAKTAGRHRIMSASEPSNSLPPSSRASRVE